MTRYVTFRVLQALMTLFLLSILVFFLARVLGDPIAFMLPFDAQPEDVKRLREQFGFNRPLLEQYWHYLADLLRGDLGDSLRQRTAVSTLIAERTLASLILTGSALLWAIIFSLLLGVLAAVHKDTWIDRVARVIAFLGQSAPPFWVGIVAIQVFSVHFGVLPAAGSGSLAHLVLPMITVGLLAVAGMTRLVRSSMIEVLDSEYIKKARIMGVPEWQVIWKHGLRNASIPLLTFAGEYFGLLIAAAVVVETVFAWPGMGRLAYEAVFTRDYPLIQGVILTLACLVLTMNLIVDLLYAVIDPRIRYGGD